jgi:IclR family transcriptional regulator, acetate operon repressor
LRTVDKALKLLDFFTIPEPEWGLSELARRAELDKATTLRMLSALVGNGLVEQHPQTRRYRLGSKLLKLARIREATSPLMSIIQPVLDRLAGGTGETAHASLASNDAMLTVGIAEPQRPTRVSIDPSEPLPFHATASGIAYLAFAPPDVVARVLSGDSLEAHTERTIVSSDAIRRKLAEVATRGYAVSERSFEMEVIGTAAPIFDASGYSCGAIAVASIASRFDGELERSAAAAVMRSATEITRATGAEPNPILLETIDEFA